MTMVKNKVINRSFDDKLAKRTNIGRSRFRWPVDVEKNI